MSQTKISPEALQKALQSLGLARADDTAAPIAAADPKLEELSKAEADLALAQAKVDEIKNGKKEPIAEPAVSVELIKAFEDKVLALGTVIQSKDEKIDELTKAVTEINTFNKELAVKIGMIAKTPLDRKALSGAKPVDRFIEKGEDNQLGNEKGVRTLSISNGKQRAEIAQELFDAATKNEGKVDEELAKACSNVELGQVTPQLQKRLFNDFKIKVVK